jgi:naphthalene 1,2-dioxygenase system ferredoxin subunit
MSNLVPVTTMQELAEGEMRCFEVAGKEILLARVDGRIYATDALCTHGLAYLEQGLLEGYELSCPLHDGCFDIRTGAATRAPAVVPIKVYATKIENDTVHVDTDAQ